MLVVLLWAQVAAAVQGQQDSTYATPTLRELVAAAATSNRYPPAELAGYQAQVESELAFVLHDTLGRERLAQAEQLAARASWDKRTGYELHVVGYRSQTAGLPLSALSMVRGWTLPTLYGDRLLLGIERSGATGVRIVRRGSRSDTIVAVHPFARDRDQYYRFSGGDTVTVLRSLDRRIPVVRIRVEPRLDVSARFAAFDGEIHIDGTRHEIVRMRGRFIEAEERSGPSLLARAAGAVAVAYVEFLNAEVEGRYWLPASQRIEFQATMAVLGDMRSIFRAVSRFSGYSVQTAPEGVDVLSLNTRRTVSYAPSDSLSTFRDWRYGIGDATSALSGDDFADLAPSIWRVGGAPVATLRPSRFDRMLRFNRVEGLYTGLEGSIDFRDAIPGLVARAHLGWAWSESTPRGGASLAQTRGSTTVGVRAERSLSSTNDFGLDFSTMGSSLGAIFGSVDDADYVDRALGAVWMSTLLGKGSSVLLTVQAGVGRDGAERARLEHGWVPGPDPFRPNRGADEGSYALGVVEYELNPDVSAEFVRAGFGSRLRYEGATGELDWQRLEGSASVRRYAGPFSISLRGDAGVVIGSSPPPQTLFELGGNERLPGYDYKEFAGDRAALFRAFANYSFPFQRSPYRIGRIFLPGLAPGLGAGLQGGWAELSSPGARLAAERLGAAWSDTAISRPTGGVRATAGFGLTFFGGAAHVGVARPIDSPAPWRWVFGFGPSF